MELIEIIEEIKRLARNSKDSDDINGNINKASLDDIYHLCENALIDYKVNKRLEQADKEFASVHKEIA